MAGIEEEEPVRTMIDVLAEEKQLEEDAAAVLGGSDPKNCTYNLGYMTRQALYACSTCTPANGSPAGICLACSLECHDGHELFELYTKRNFCCDCGNSKFPSDSKCKLNPDRKPLNANNVYNQNFRGLYCTCSRPYPDNEDEVEDEMIQCIICEDWYHGRHLGNVPENDDYDEMICNSCMTKYNFLCYYNVQSKVVPVIKHEDTKEIVEVIDPVNKQTTDDKINSPDYGNNSIKIEPSCSSDNHNCLLEDLKKRSLENSVDSGATYWIDGWRKKLCQCEKCLDMYTQQDVSFLTDPGDTVISYEEKGLNKGQGGSQYEQGMKALSGMDRVKQVEVIHGYNDMKTELKDYLAKFAENGKVVREEDIKEFFENLRARKKQKTGSGMPASFCR